MRRSAWALVIAAPLVLILASGFGHNPNAVHSPLVGHHAPVFSLRSFDGRQVSMAELRGKPLVINFWASWCLSCKDEHGYLRQAWRAYGRRVAFVGIAYQDQVTDARAFLRRYGGGWPELDDPSQATAIDYGVYGVPETFFVDRHGVIRFKSTGPVTWSVLRTQIGRLLS